MKLLVVVSCLLAVACAKPGVVSPLAYSSIIPSSYGYSYSSHVAAPAVAYSAHSVAAPAVAYSTHPVSAPAVAYSSHYAAPTFRSAVVAPSVHSTVVGPSAHSTIVGPSVHSAVVAPAVRSAVVAAPAVHSVHSAVVAAPAVHSAVVAAPAVVGVEKTQYHAQDELGQAAYGHSEAFQAHNAVQDANGNKIGSYSYVAPNGQVLATNYVADALGYRVATNAAPLESSDVVAARAAHLAEFEAVKHRSRRSPGVFATSYASPLAYHTPYTTYGATPFLAARTTAYGGRYLTSPHAYAYRYY